jgi:two-component system cell cycle sensor histidine kinase/response regulator CckA
MKSDVRAGRALYLGLFLSLILVYGIAIFSIVIWDIEDKAAILGIYSCCTMTVMTFVLWGVYRFSTHKNVNDQIEAHYKELIFADTKVTLLVDRELCCHEVLFAKKTAVTQHKTLEDCYDALGITASSLEIIQCFILQKPILQDHRTGFFSIKSDVLYIHQDSNLLEIIVQKSQNNELYCIKVRYAATENSRLMQLMPIGYFELDRDGALYKVNRQFASYLGYSLPESIIETGISLHDLIVSRSGGAELVPHKFYQSFNQEIVSIKTQRGEIETFLLILCPQLNEEQGAFGFLTRLRQKEIDYFSDHLEKYWIDYSWKCFFDNSPYPVCIASVDGIISKVNASYINQVANHTAGYNFLDLFVEEDAHNLKHKMHSMAAGVLEPQILPMTRQKDGSKIFEVFLGNILNLDGKFHAFIVRVTDVTQRKHLEDNLSHAQRMQTIGQLVGSVAHDFNNILTAISGFCDLLLLHHSVGDPSFANIMQIKQSADRASLLIQRLLAFSRKQTLQMQAASPLDLFSDFSPIIQRLVGTQVQFVQRIAQNIWNINVDLVQIEQVILNLVVNAQQAMQQQDGKLEIYVSNLVLHEPKAELSGYLMPPGEKGADVGEYVEIIVKDNGCGIEFSKIPRIFEPFYTTKSHISGTGLGLSTVYGVIKQCGGFLFIKSEVGLGTEFKILLPRCKETIKLQQEHNIRETEFNSSRILLPGNATVVLVEDEDAIRVFVKNVLVTKGYKVHDFSSAERAVESVAEKALKFDLLITDVVMPEMSGPKLVEKLRVEHPECKVIFISGYAEEAFSQEYGQQRHFHFLPKPFSLKQLVLKVQEVLARD